MIEIAIISDIHGNLPALNIVLKDIEKRSINQMYCLGDLVDFAPWGNEVIEVIKAIKIPCLLGNHDERIAFNLPVIPIAHHDEHETLQRVTAINHSKNTITEANKLWLSQLPYNVELQYKIKGSYKKILLVHASTRSNDEYIHIGHDEEDLKSMFLASKADVIVMGHTHISYEKKINVNGKEDKLLVNGGSVGRSREANRLASYAILRIYENEIKAEIVKLEYPIEQVAEAIYKSGIPDFYGDFLLQYKMKI